MTQPETPAPTSASVDDDTTIIGGLEMSEKKWVLAVQLPDIKRHTRAMFWEQAARNWPQ